MFDSPFVQGSNLLGFITSRYSISKWRDILKKTFNNGSEVVYKKYKLQASHSATRALFCIHILYLDINLIKTGEHRLTVNTIIVGSIPICGNEYHIIIAL